MYQEIRPSTGEIVDIYADNIPMTGEDTMIGGAIPVKKHHFEVEKNEIFNGTLDRPSLDRIIEPVKKNDVLDVMILEPVVKAEDSKIDIAKVFELVLENPCEEAGDAGTPMFMSLDSEILEIDAEGNLTPKVELGQVNVCAIWPSGVSAEILVTIGEVSEIKPADKVLGGDIVEPEAPEQGGGEEPEPPVDPEPEDPSEPDSPELEDPEEGGEEPEPPVDPEPEDPSEPDSPELEDPEEGGEIEEAKIMYGLMPIAEHMESIDAITADDLINADLTKVEVAALDKTLLPVVENNFVIVLVPVESGLTAYRDNGLGAMEPFAEEVMGCNGQKTYMIGGNEYKLFAELRIVGASDFFIYVV